MCMFEEMSVIGKEFYTVNRVIKLVLDGAQHTVDRLLIISSLRILFMLNKQCFNWSIIVSPWGRQDEYHDDDNCQLLIRPTISLSHPIYPPPSKNSTFNPLPRSIVLLPFFSPSPEKTQSLKLLFHSKQMRITKFDQMKNEIQYFLTTGGGLGKGAGKPFFPRLHFTLA